MNTRYVLRYAYSNYEGTPADETNGVLYLYKSVNRDKHGYLRPRVTTDVSRARTWATRAGAEGYLADKLTYFQSSQYVVQEVAS